MIEIIIRKKNPTKGRYMSGEDINSLILGIPKF